jgi:hypothetical protein
MMSDNEIKLKGATMSDSEIDRTLSQRDEILPSSGFVLSVMDAVRQEAAAPAPIPFPWKRALPFVVLGAAALALMVVAVVGMATHLGSDSVVSKVSSASPLELSLGMESGLRWAVLTLVGTFVLVKISLRLAGGRT